MPVSAPGQRAIRRALAPRPAPQPRGGSSFGGLNRAQSRALQRSARSQYAAQRQARMPAPRPLPVPHVIAHPFQIRLPHPQPIPRVYRNLPLPTAHRLVNMQAHPLSYTPQEKLRMFGFQGASAITNMAHQRAQYAAQVAHQQAVQRAYQLAHQPVHRGFFGTAEHVAGIVGHRLAAPGEGLYATLTGNQARAEQLRRQEERANAEFTGALRYVGEHTARTAWKVQSAVPKALIQVGEGHPHQAVGTLKGFLHEQRQIAQGQTIGMHPGWNAPTVLNAVTLLPFLRGPRTLAEALRAGYTAEEGARVVEASNAARASWRANQGLLRPAYAAGKRFVLPSERALARSEARAAWFRSLDQTQSRPIAAHYKRITDQILKGMKARGTAADIHEAVGRLKGVDTHTIFDAHGRPLRTVASSAGMPEEGLAQGDHALFQSTRDIIPKAPKHELPANLDIGAIADKILAEHPKASLPKEMRTRKTLIKTITRVYEHVGQGMDYRDWYQRYAKVAHLITEDLGGVVTPEQFARIRAVASQQANPTEEIRRAVTMIKQYHGQELPLHPKTGEPWTYKGLGKAGTPANQNAKVAQIIEQGVHEGEKTNNYYLNALKYLNPKEYASTIKELGLLKHPVTVDRHITKMVAPSLGETPGKAYEPIADIFRHLGDATGLSPEEVQAAAWVPWKAKGLQAKQIARGFADKGFENYIPTAADAGEFGRYSYSGTLFQGGEKGSTASHTFDSKVAQVHSEIRPEQRFWPERAAAFDQWSPEHQAAYARLVDDAVGQEFEHALGMKVGGKRDGMGVWRGVATPGIAHHVMLDGELTDGSRAQIEALASAKGMAKHQASVSWGIPRPAGEGAFSAVHWTPPAGVDPAQAAAELDKIAGEGNVGMIHAPDGGFYVVDFQGRLGSRASTTKAIQDLGGEQTHIGWDGSYTYDARDPQMVQENPGVESYQSAIAKLPQEQQSALEQAMAKVRARMNTIDEEYFGRSGSHLVNIHEARALAPAGTHTFHGAPGLVPEQIMAEMRLRAGGETNQAWTTTDPELAHVYAGMGEDRNILAIPRDRVPLGEANQPHPFGALGVPHDILLQQGAGADTVRLYRGEQMGEGVAGKAGRPGGNWFTPDREFASVYAHNGVLKYVDVPKAEAEKYLTGTLKHPPSHVTDIFHPDAGSEFELPPELSAQARPLLQQGEPGQFDHLSLSELHARQEQLDAQYNALVDDWLKAEGHRPGDYKRLTAYQNATAKKTLRRTGTRAPTVSAMLRDQAELHLDAALEADPENPLAQAIRADQEEQTALRHEIYKRQDAMLWQHGDLQGNNYEGQVGNQQHLTRTEKGVVPTSSVADLHGVKGEVPGEHRNRTGADWEAFKADVQKNGIQDPVFITVDHNGHPLISEGSHRRDAAVELGHTHVPVEVRYFGHAEQQGTLTERAALQQENKGAFVRHDQGETGSLHQFENADATTPGHELTHFNRAFNTTAAENHILAKEMGATQMPDGTWHWHRQAEENYAQAVAWMYRNGEAPRNLMIEWKDLQKEFQRIYPPDELGAAPSEAVQKIIKAQLGHENGSAIVHFLLRRGRLAARGLTPAQAPGRPRTAEEARLHVEQANRARLLRGFGIKAKDIPRFGVGETSDATAGDLGRQVREHVAGYVDTTGMGEHEGIGAKQELRSQKEMRKEVKAGYARERGRRSSEGDLAYERAGGGEAGHIASKAEQKGKLPTEATKGLDLNQAERDHLYDFIQNHPAISGVERHFARTRARDALDKLIKGEPIQLNEQTLLEHLFGRLERPTSLKEEWKQKSTWGKFVDIMNLPRSLMATGDQSAAFRHGIMALAHSPREWARQWGPMYKQMFSEKNYGEIQAAIHEMPTYGLMVGGEGRTGIAYTEAGQKLDQREELYASNAAEQLPYIGRIVRGSDRGYIGFLNGMRAAQADKLYHIAAQEGWDLNDAHLVSSINKFVNSATGRGDLQKLQKHAVTLNALLFSPRLLWSRLNFLDPFYYHSLHPFARRQALQSLTNMLMGASALMYMAKLGGAQIVTDPRSSDFGKMKFGNTRIDFLGGFQQPIVLAARLLTQTSISSTTGRPTHLSGKAFGMSSFDILLKFFANKLAPIPSAGYEAATMKDPLSGQPVGRGSFLPDIHHLFGPEGSLEKNFILKRMTPLLLQDIASLPPGPQSALSLLPAVGIGAQAYGPPLAGQKALDAINKATRQAGLGKPPAAVIADVKWKAKLNDATYAGQSNRDRMLAAAKIFDERNGTGMEKQLAGMQMTDARAAAEYTRLASHIAPMYDHWMTNVTRRIAAEKGRQPVGPAPTATHASSAGAPPLATAPAMSEAAYHIPAGGARHLGAHELPAAHGLPPELGHAISSAAAKYGVPAATLQGIWAIESGRTFPNPAVNSSGYGGLFGTSKWNASTQEQADYAAQTLSHLLTTHHGNMAAALSAYSGGGYSSVNGAGGGPVHAGGGGGAGMGPGAPQFASLTTGGGGGAGGGGEGAALETMLQHLAAGNYNPAVFLTKTLHAFSSQPLQGNVQGINFELPKGGKAAPQARGAIALAEHYLGTPYVWGGESPRGFDCSGLLQFIYARQGIQIPRTSQQQFESGQRVGRGGLRPGDAVFFSGSDGTRSHPGHVGIYIGGGRFIEAPHSGTTVRVSNLNGMPGYVGARRFAR